MFQIIEIGFPLLAGASLLVYEVEKGVRSATSCKDSRFIHIYDLEEDLLPYLDRDTLHVERKRVVCLEFPALVFKDKSEQLRKYSCAVACSS